MNQLMELMNHHRSIRTFSERKVENEELQEIIATAQMASTSNFIQAYSVIHVNDREKRKKLAAYSGNQAYIEKAPVFLVFCADLFRLKTVIENNHGEPIFSTIENFILTTVDTSLFAQNVMLAAESKGLGGVYIGGVRNNPADVSKLLELPELVYPVFGMCLGYPIEDIPDRKKRLPLSVVLHQDTYQRDVLDEIKGYDEEIKAYYQARTNGENNDTWSDKMTKQFSKPLRKHLRGFLGERGFQFE